MNRGVLSIITVAACILGGFCCDRRSAPTTQASRPAASPLRIGLNIWPGYGAFLIADEKGFYRDEGVEVRIEVIQGDPEREAALASGNLDGVGMTIDNLVLLRNRGIDVKAIYKYDGSFGADGIVATEGIQTPSDLKGKKVAWAPGTTSHFFLTQVLKAARLATKDLEHVAMSSDDAGAAFAAGHLDAAVTWEPWLTKARESGKGRVLISTKELPVVEDVLFLHSETLRARREDVTRMLRACFKAVDYWEAHKKESSEIIAQRFNLPVADVDGMLSGIKIMDLSHNREFFGKQGNDAPAFKAFEIASETWLEAGLIKKLETPENGIDPSYIRSL